MSKFAKIFTAAAFSAALTVCAQQSVNSVPNQAVLPSAGNLGAVQKVGATPGSLAPAVGDADYQSVASTPLGAGQNSLQVIANRVIDQNIAYFTGTTNAYVCAGPAYCSAGVYAEDYTYSLLFNPSRFDSQSPTGLTPASILNVANAFMSVAATQTGKQVPLAINQAGTGAAYQYSVADSNHAYLSGVAMYMVPFMDYEYYLKTGSTAGYTAHVANLKTAWAYPPLNGVTGCPSNTVGASEWIPQSLFLEIARFSGDVANACVLRSAAAAVEYKMALASGDATNATYFNNIFTLTSASIQSEFIDATTHMLIGSTGQANQIDVLTSGMAVWFSNYTGMNIITPTQQANIGTFLHTHLGTMTYNGYFANSVNSSGSLINWSPYGFIPSGGGGSGYTAACTGGDANPYQNGYWSLVTGMNALALSLTNPSDVSTLLASFRDAASGNSGDPGYEYYTGPFGHNSGSCGTATTPNAVSPQSAAWAAANITSATPIPATLAATDKYGALVNSLPSSVTVSNAPLVFSSTTPPTIGLTSASTSSTAFYLENTSAGGHKTEWFQNGSGAPAGLASCSGFYDLTASQQFAQFCLPAFSVLDSQGIGWNAAGSSIDTAFWRTGAGTVALGNGTQYDASGSLKLADFHVVSPSTVNTVIQLKNSSTGGKDWSIFVNGSSAGASTGFWGLYDATDSTAPLQASSNTVIVNSGTNTVYRCTTAGALPIGALTIATGNCGASTDTGLRVP